MPSNASVDWKNVPGTATEYAVILVGNKQHTVTVGSKISCEKLDADVEKDVTADVLFWKKDGQVVVGKPTLESVSVTLKVVSHNRDKKVITFKKQRRHVYQKRMGHKQHFTVLQVVSINGAAK